MRSIYTKPKVSKPADTTKPWFVWFRYDGKLQRYKLGINYIKNLKERDKEAKALCDALLERLKIGWNPLVPDVVSEFADMTLFASLDFALAKKKENLAAKTYSGYKGSVEFIKTAILALELQCLRIKDTKRVHIKTILEKIKQQREASNHAYNKYLDHFRAVLGELLQWDVIEFNPANNIRSLPVSESYANHPATQQQHQIIKRHLEKHFLYFHNFIVTLFHTGIRPEEILQIKLGMIDMQNFEITLPAEITKTDKVRIVPINKYFYEMLLSMNFQNLPKDYYLFGSFRKKGKGNVGGKLDFVPGHTRIKRDTATKRWNKIVKVGLKINVNMYSYKKAGANAKILAGMDLDSLRELYGHSSTIMTKKYITKIQEVHRRQIMQYSPDF